MRCHIPSDKRLSLPKRAAQAVGLSRLSVAGDSLGKVLGLAARFLIMTHSSEGFVADIETDKTH